MKRLVLTLVICLGWFGPLTAQDIWKPINVEGSLLGVSSDGSIFAYSDYYEYVEIVRSLDEGETWQVVLSSEPEPDVRFLENGFAISEEGRIFVLGEHQEDNFDFCLFYSDDNGDTWQQTTEIPNFLVSGMVEFGGITAPTNDIIVCWSSGGDYTWSIDGGATWSYTYKTPPHDGSYLPHQLCDVIVNASGDLYASYMLYSGYQAASMRTNIFDISSWQGLYILDGVIWDMEFGPDGYAFLGICGNEVYIQDDRYFIFSGQSIAVSDNDVVYRLRYIDDTHAVLSYSPHDANNFFDVGEVMELHEPYSNLLCDGNIYKGQDKHLYFHGNGQYWKSIPNANDIPSLNDWIGVCFFDEVSNLYYIIRDTSTVEVTWSNGAQYQGAFVIPETVSYMGTAYTVTGIEKWAFYNLSEVTFVDIPEAVTHIGDRAFYHCTGLDSISISNSVTSIGKWAFSACESLESIYIPNSVFSIGERVFSNCNNLKSVHLPESLETIEPYSFYGCFELQSVILPESLKKIKDWAFRGCSQLTEIVVPQNVDTICNDAFGFCDNLSMVELGQSVNCIGFGAFRPDNPTGRLTVICHNPNPAQCDRYSFPQAEYQEIVILPCGCEEAYRSAWADCWQSGNFEEDCGLVGSEWYYEIQNDNGSITYQYLYQAGDTIVQDEPTHILVKINTLYDKDLHQDVTHEYVYERDGKVYWWNKTLEEFTMLYDFGAQEGDSWVIKVGTETLTMHVDAVEEIEYEGRTYRMLRVSDPEDLFSGNIVCGIGHLTSFFPERLMDNGDGIRVEGMRCYWSEGELVFKYGDEDCDAVYSEVHGIEEDGPSTGSEALTVYPNPTNGVLNISVRLPQCDSPTAQTYRITNLIGQTLLASQIITENQQINVSSLPQGMYFITIAGETRKFVVR